MNDSYKLEITVCTPTGEYTVHKYITTVEVRDANFDILKTSAHKLVDQLFEDVVKL